MFDVVYPPALFFPAYLFSPHVVKSIILSFFFFTRILGVILFRAVDVWKRWSANIGIGSASLGRPPLFQSVICASFRFSFVVGFWILLFLLHDLMRLSDWRRCHRCTTCVYFDTGFFLLLPRFPFSVPASGHSFFLTPSFLSVFPPRDDCPQAIGFEQH